MSQPGRGWGGGAVRCRREEEKKDERSLWGQMDRWSSLWCGGEGGTTSGIRKKHFKCHSLCVQTTEAPG